jgi:hypothetical protein
MTLAGCMSVETMPEPRGSGVPAAHPLDPLTAGEIDAAVILKAPRGRLLPDPGPARAAKGGSPRLEAPQLPSAIPG